ncbi:MAG: hypothetical protein LBL46_04290 [Rickettsiales bacterium]|jgi:hypothetical protein|nr:hypothetical protein [Rickettsiales bacterium]
MKKITILAAFAAISITGCGAADEGGFPKFGETNYWDCGDNFKRLAVKFADKENGEMTTIVSLIQLTLDSETETERVYKSKSSYTSQYGFVVKSDGKADFVRYKERIPCEKSKDE